VTNLQQAVTDILAALPQIITGMVDFFTSMFGSIAEVGITC
jgi:hypothetical protein